jgi:hypothetical protein
MLVVMRNAELVSKLVALAKGDIDLVQLAVRTIAKDGRARRSREGRRLHCTAAKSKGTLLRCTHEGDTWSPFCLISPSGC